MNTLEIKCFKCGAPIVTETEADVSDQEILKMVQRLMRFTKCDRCMNRRVTEAPTPEEYEQKLPYKDL